MLSANSFLFVFLQTLYPVRTDEESSISEEVRITSEQSRSCGVSVAINQVSSTDCSIAYLCRVKGGILRNCNDFKPLTKLRKAT